MKIEHGNIASVIRIDGKAVVYHSPEEIEYPQEYPEEVKKQVEEMFNNVFSLPVGERNDYLLKQRGPLIYKFEIYARDKGAIEDRRNITEEVEAYTYYEAMDKLEEKYEEIHVYKYSTEPKKHGNST